MQNQHFYEQADELNSSDIQDPNQWTEPLTPSSSGFLSEEEARDKVSYFVSQVFKPRKTNFQQKLQILSQVIIYLDESLPPNTTEESCIQRILSDLLLA